MIFLVKRTWIVRRPRTQCQVARLDGVDSHQQRDVIELTPAGHPERAGGLQMILRWPGGQKYMPERRQHGHLRTPGLGLR